MRLFKKVSLLNIYRKSYKVTKQIVGMRIFLVRHGDLEIDGKDPPLTRKGIIQAKRLAKRLTKLKIDKVYTSDSRRAFQTFQEYHKLKPKIPFVKTPTLREIYRTILGGPTREGTPNDRTAKDKARADNFFNNLFKKLNNKNILIFAHGNLIRYFIAKVLDINPKKLWQSLVVSCASISIIKKDKDSFHVKMINSIEHLPKKEVHEIYHGSKN